VDSTLLSQAGRGSSSEALRASAPGDEPGSGSQKRGSIFGGRPSGHRLHQDAYQGWVDDPVPKEGFDRSLTDSAVHEDQGPEPKGPELIAGQMEYDMRIALAASGFSDSDVDRQIALMFHTTPEYEETEPPPGSPF
jgi:hypothetical protein